MNTVLHKAASRGHAAHGWLDSWHSFSFAAYHNPERVHFGVLRVLNDDTVAPGMGFGKHPHDNMEIISIPLEGDLQHEDSTGTKQIIKQGDVQIMSAGTGIAHSEKNASSTKPVKFLQIWVFPDKKNVTPRYDQKTFGEAEKQNKFVTVVSPFGESEGVHIHQNAWFSLGNFDKDFETTYSIKKSGNGAYFFVLEGDVTINNTPLNRRDGLGIWAFEKVDLKATSDTKLLVMDLPMQ